MAKPILLTLLIIFIINQQAISLLTNASYFKKKSNNKPYIVAHRGASGHLPEHTLQGHTTAMYMNADFVEPDLQPTKDNHLIVIHGLLSETTNVADHPEFKDRLSTKLFEGVNVTDWYAEDFTLDEIKQLKRRQRYQFRNHMYDDIFTIPTFEEYIETVMETNKYRQSQNNNSTLIGIYPELKYPDFFDSQGFNVSELLFNVLKKYNLTDYQECEKKLPVIIQNFYPYVLEFFRDNTNLPLVYLVMDAKKVDFNNITKYAHGVSPQWKLLFDENLQIIKKSHENNLQVVPWTIQDDALTFGQTACEQYKILERLGVDAIFTEFPDNANSYFTSYFCQEKSNYNYNAEFSALSQ